MKPLFFGQPDRSRFGIYHAAMGSNAGPVRAVVLCPPIGQEYIRSHWTLRLAASQLARKGVHVMRFDYAGLGDSPGNVFEIPSLETWQDDIVSATSELISISGAQNVMLMGMRLGATMATKVACQKPNLVNSLVSWEAINEGDVYLTELRAMHRRMIDLWVCRTKTPDDEQYEEILGSRYARSLINELESFVGGFEHVPQPQLIYQLASHPLDFVPREPYIVKRVMTGDEYSWNALPELELAFLRTKTLRQIVSGVTDLFDRLQKFGLLGEAVHESLTADVVVSGS